MSNASHVLGVKVTGRGGKRAAIARGSTKLEISIKVFGRSTAMWPPREIVYSRVSVDMPSMSAGHLVAPVVAYQCVLRRVFLTQQS